MENKRLVTIDCPVCGCAVFRRILSWKEEGSSIVRCSGCALLYVNPRMTGQEIKHFFEKDYIRTHREVEEVYDHSRGKTLSIIAAAVKRKKAGGRLLDVGCAAGKFLSLFAGESGWELHGADVSEFAARKAKKIKGARIYNDDIMNLGLADGYFDVVVMLDSLYFLPDPVTVLKEVRRVMKQDGILIIELPGLARMLWKAGPVSLLLKGRWNSFTPNQHLFFFSKKTLGALLKKTGFYIDSVELVQSPQRKNMAVEAVNSAYLLFSNAVHALTMKRFCISSRVVYSAMKAD